MDIKNKYLLSIIIAFVLLSCNLSDYSENLGEGYNYIDEGGDIKEIFNNKPKFGRVPATVIEFKYDNNFIVAKQKPRLPQDPLYEKKYKYPYGDDQFYYWLVLKKDGIVLGPFNLEDYNSAKSRHNVSDKLKLK
jgi:hypothetical protein